MVCRHLDVGAVLWVLGVRDLVVMTCRVTPRPLGTIVPFEMGVREDGGS
jgi:hypothetical protein